MLRTCIFLRTLLVGIGLLGLPWAAFPQGSEYPAMEFQNNYMSTYYLAHNASPTPLAPEWSPEGDAIAVSMYGSIWKIELGSGTATELTYNQKYHSHPEWSPDGKWIIYTAEDQQWETIQLEILNTETGESRALTDDNHVYLDPAFSPDGSKVAYVSSHPDGKLNVFIRAIRDGRWAGEPIRVTEDNKYRNSRLYFGLWDLHIEPAWTPDGRELLLVSNKDVPLGSGNVWRLPAEENGFRKAEVVLDEQTLYRTRPDVSIDGKRFVYSSTSGAADQSSHLYVLPTTGGHPYKLTFGDHDHFYPRWSPDGEWIAHVSNEGGLPSLWLLETYGGKQKKVEVTDYEWKRPTGKLTVKITSGETVVPARVSLSASDGKFYAPTDAYPIMARLPGLVGLHIFFSDGEFTVDVPEGPLQLDVSKGFQYQPVSRRVRVRANHTTSVHIPLPKLENVNSSWHSGTTHTHMNYGGTLRNTLPNVMLAAKAQDVEIVSVLPANKDNRILDWQYFVKGGGEHPVSQDDPDSVVIVGEEYRPPFWGHTFFIGLKDHLISPFLTGYEGTGVESLYPSNTDMFIKARKQGAAVGYVHAFGGDRDPVAGSLGGGKGFGVDLALGTVDAFEWSAPSRGSVVVLHHALNNDFSVAPVGGEDAIHDLRKHRPIGTTRTHAYLPEGPSAQGWIDAIKTGRTYVSSGPLVDFRITNNERPSVEAVPGESLQFPEDGGEVVIRTKVTSITPLTKVQIYRNGVVWKDVPIGQNSTWLDLRETATVDESGWFGLVVEAETYPKGDPDAYFQAVTNGVRVYVGDQKIRNRASAEYFIRWLDKLRPMAEDWFGWRSQKEKDHVFRQFEQAREVYEQRAAEASQ